MCEESLQGKFELKIFKNIFTLKREQIKCYLIQEVHAFLLHYLEVVHVVACHI